MIDWFIDWLVFNSVYNDISVYRDSKAFIYSDSIWNHNIWLTSVELIDRRLTSFPTLFQLYLGHSFCPTADKNHFD